MGVGAGGGRGGVGGARVSVFFTKNPNLTYIYFFGGGGGGGLVGGGGEARVNEIVYYGSKL